MPTVNDRIEIQQLVDLYGHIVDERQFWRVGEVFTEDAEYDVRKRSAGLHRGVAEIRRLWEETAQHPLAHHATNIVIEEESEGSASVRSKGICVHEDGSVHSTTYRQRAERTGAGWRISYLSAEMRAPEMTPPPS
jgi:hypothetical protein